ncbi:MAG: smc 7, partial [Phycisphaerales bacterium]|nr:smc 7 [Phycisphaerales bacterium]
MSDTTLHERLRTMKRRLLAVGVSASMGWGLALAALLLMLSMWLDLVLDLAPVPRVICGIASAVIGLAMLARLSLSAWRQSAPAAVARRLDQAAGARGQILSGVDLLLRPASSGKESVAVARAQGGDALTAGLAKLAMDRAATLAAKVPTGAAAPARPLYRPASGLLCLGAAAVFVGMGLPRLAATQWERFFDPFGDHPPYSRIQFTVAPGDTKVIYGGTLDIRATTNGEPIESAEVVFKT